MHPAQIVIPRGIRKTMNNVIGIVAEFNPIHYGHCYLMETAKEAVSADAVACVMSGNFVQRGAPAIYDKWERTSMALECGVDLVIEIPTVFCLGNASIYARAGVQLLEALGVVTHLAFGSESGDGDTLLALANSINARNKEIEASTRARIAGGWSYPAARQQVIEEMLSVNMADFTSPNDILALEYLRNIRTLHPLPIQRVGADYHDSAFFSEKLYSSTSVREALRKDQLRPSAVPWSPMKHALKPQLQLASGNSRLLPEETTADLYDRMNAKWFDLIRYRILSSTPEELDRSPGGGEGLGNRIREAARSATSIEELILATKSKRYTYTRISRWLYQILLGIHREDPMHSPEYLRILGFTEKGRELIREAKKRKRNTIPFVENINRWQEKSIQLDMDIHASDMYNLVCGNDIRLNSDYCRQLIAHPKFNG